MSLALLFPWLFQISKVDRYAAFSTVFGCHLTAGELLSRMSDKEEIDSLNTPAEGPTNIHNIFPNGDRYEGECSSFAPGVIMRSGTGSHTSASGIIYTGEWHEDKMHGRGCLQHPSGALYEGEFKDNMYHGIGTYTFPDGSVYTGHFHKNRFQGEGAFINTQGLVWKGDFFSKAAPGLEMQLNM